MDSNQPSVIRLTDRPGFSPAKPACGSPTDQTAHSGPRDVKITGKYASPDTRQRSLRHTRSLTVDQ